MKKITLTATAFLLLLTFASKAQKASFGIQAGASYSNFTVSYEGDSESGDYKPGITAGIMIDKSIGKSLYFQPALNFVQKGYQKTQDNEKMTVNFNYLELPLNIVYRKKTGSGFFVGGGPSVGMGLAGTTKYMDETEKIEFGGEYNGDRFEVEANFITGYKFANKMQVAFNVNLGLTNLMDSDVKMKNHYFGLRLGYYFK